MSRRGQGHPSRQPATTPEGRENQLISYAMDLAETQLRDGSASSQVITHFLKAGATREGLEQARIQHENLLLSAKVDQLASAKKVEELYEEALGAFKQYRGTPDEESFDEYYED